MARQSRTIDTPAEISESKSMRALGHLDRMAGFVEESSRIARATAGIAMPAGHRWQLPAHAAFLKYDRRPEAGTLANRKARADGSQSGLENTPGRNGGNFWGSTASAAPLIRTFAAGARALNATARVSDGVRGNEAATSMAQLRDSDRAIARVDADGRASREIRALSLATDALSRVERSIELGSAAWATSTAGRRTTRSGLKSSSEFAVRAHRAIEISQAMVAANTESSPSSGAGRVSSRSRGSLEAEREAFAGTGLLASARMASSIRAVMPPANLSQREFAEPSGNARGASNSGVRTGITINSSPTVVINAPAAGGNIARDAIGALRAHREELFNQLKRESARRERAQF